MRLGARRTLADGAAQVGAARAMDAATVAVTAPAQGLIGLIRLIGLIAIDDRASSASPNPIAP